MNVYVLSFNSSKICAPLISPVRMGLEKKTFELDGGVPAALFSRF